MTALVFDFDGTILDTETPVFEAWAATFRHFGVEPVTLETWLTTIGMASKESPSAALAIEDSTHGVSAAIAAGLRCIAAPGPITTTPDSDDLHITNAAIGQWIERESSQIAGPVSEVLLADPALGAPEQVVEVQVPITAA